MTRTCTNMHAGVLLCCLHPDKRFTKVAFWRIIRLQTALISRMTRLRPHPKTRHVDCLVL